jgi:hypothetical protein
VLTYCSEAQTTRTEEERLTSVQIGFTRQAAGYTFFDHEGMNKHRIANIINRIFYKILKKKSER